MYYLWFNGTQSGPYTLQQVQSMWNAGQITSETLFWQDDATEWLPLGNIVSIIEAKPTESPMFKTAVIPHLQTFGQLSQRGNLPPKPEVEPEPAAGEKDVWTGHPTLWKWGWWLLLGLILVLLPISLFIFAPQLSVMIDLAPLPVALIIFLSIFLSRNSTRYIVTSKRVGMENGIFTKTSRELRIQDIRSIAAKTNFLGYGNIEFSSAASDDAEVTFLAVSGAASVRDTVKKLQS